jgi:hypothetical protein
LIRGSLEKGRKQAKKGGDLRKEREDWDMLEMRLGFVLQEALDNLLQGVFLVFVLFLFFSLKHFI